MSGKKGRKRIRVLDIPIDAVTREEALDRISGFIADGHPHTVFTPNAEIIYQAQTDGHLQEILRQADLLVPDGFGLLWASRFLRTPLPERVAGIDLMHGLLSRAAGCGHRIFLLGAEPDVVERAAVKLRETYPGIEIAGVQHGYFPAAATGSVVERIKALEPAILLVGMGAPRQEKWIWEHYREMQVPVCLGVGGSFDVAAGKLRRAPPWMQKSGLEWLFRLASEPKRLRRMLALPLFVMAVLKKWNRKRGGRENDQ